MALILQVSLLHMEARLFLRQHQNQLQQVQFKVVHHMHNTQWVIVPNLHIQAPQTCMHLQVLLDMQNTHLILVTYRVMQRLKALKLDVMGIEKAQLSVQPTYHSVHYITVRLLLAIHSPNITEQAMIRNLVNTNRNVVYRYVGNKSGKNIEVVISHNELRDFL